MRTTRSSMFIEIARVVSRRATCQRLSVGAVLVKGRSIVSIGYNGAPAGSPHCSGNDCPGRFSCHETIHAEINALYHLPDGVTGPLDLYVTDSPCAQCYQDIMQDNRIKRIFFETPYRQTTHLDTIPEGWEAPEIYRITPSGYVTNWRTKELVEPAT